MSLRGPDRTTGTSGSTASFNAVAQITTLGINPGEPGAQGWSLSISTEGCIPISATVDGTVAEKSDFKVAQLVDPSIIHPTTGQPQGDGVVSAAVLSFRNPVTLDPSGGPHDVLRIGLQAMVAEECSPCKLRYFDDLTGRGQPVPNVIVLGGESWCWQDYCQGPVTHVDKTIRVCPAVPCNKPPECGQATATPDLLWPPNHTLQRVKIQGVSDPDGDPVTIAIDRVTQDEAVEEAGSGNTCPDAVLVDADADGIPESAGVRAERSGKGNGRVYVIHFTARDGNGGRSSGSVAVVVPSDNGRESCKTPACADSGQAHDSTACAAGGAGAAITAGKPSAIGVVELYRLTPEPTFLRGDVNFDGDQDVSDAVTVLLALFLGQAELSCEDSADVNDDGGVNVTDVIALLGHLFTGSGRIQAPADSVGPDPTSDSLYCK